MKKYKALIAEDDKDIVEILKLYLSKEFNIFTAANGKEALDIIMKEEIDIVLIDIMMPVMDGYELLSAIRKDSNIPAIIISAKNERKDKIKGINNGADVYITKPFDPVEVLAIVKSMIRRCYEYKEKDKIIKIGKLELDENDYILKKNGRKIDLTNIELKILSKMMKNPSKVFTREELYKSINDNYTKTDANTIMVHIANIRNKINDEKHEYIKTIRGVGYKIEEK